MHKQSPKPLKCAKIGFQEEAPFPRNAARSRAEP